MTTKNPQTVAEAKLLLPWRVTGRLSAREVDLVESALAHAPELEDDLAVAKLERQAVVVANETAGAPSSGALEALFARIDREPAARTPPSFPWSWFAPASWSPRALAWSAGVAALMCLLQAGALAVLLTGRDAGRDMKLASKSSESNAAERSEVAVRFAPGTEIGTVTSFLDRYRSSIIGGPKQGLYRVKVPAGEGRESARRMSEERGVVEFAASVE